MSFIIASTRNMKVKKKLRSSTRERLWGVWETHLRVMVIVFRAMMVMMAISK
jgi:hypothetical protein